MEHSSIYNPVGYLLTADNYVLFFVLISFVVFLLAKRRGAETSFKDFSEEFSFARILGLSWRIMKSNKILILIPLMAGIGSADDSYFTGYLVGLYRDFKVSFIFSPVLLGNLPVTKIIKYIPFLILKHSAYLDGIWTILPGMILSVLASWPLFLWFSRISKGKSDEYTQKNKFSLSWITITLLACPLLTVALWIIISIANDYPDLKFIYLLSSVLGLGLFAATPVFAGLWLAVLHHHACKVVEGQEATQSESSVEAEVFETWIKVLPVMIVVLILAIPMLFFIAFPQGDMDMDSFYIRGLGYIVQSTYKSLLFIMPVVALYWKGNLIGLVKSTVTTTLDNFRKVWTLIVFAMICFGLFNYLASINLTGGDFYPLMYQINFWSVIQSYLNGMANYLLMTFVIIVVIVAGVTGEIKIKKSDRLA